MIQNMTEPFHGYSRINKEKLGQVNPAVILVKSISCGCAKVESGL